MQPTIIQVLKARTSTVEAKLAARFKPVRVLFPADMKPAQIAEAHAMMDRIQKIAKQRAPAAGC